MHAIQAEKQMASRSDRLLAFREPRETQRMFHGFAEGQQAVAARGHLFLCLNGMHILPGQACLVKRVACFSGVARVKRVCLRFVGVCLRLIYVFILII
jgi:hypothetical protein